MKPWELRIGNVVRTTSPESQGPGFTDYVIATGRDIDDAIWHIGKPINPDELLLTHYCYKRDDIGNVLELPHKKHRKVVLSWDAKRLSYRAFIIKVEDGLTRGSVMLGYIEYMHELQKNLWYAIMGRDLKTKKGNTYPT